jgi:Chondroitin N-acetylgalactosaminyltransferase
MFEPICSSRGSGINIVVPLSGRLEAFRSFLRRFEQILTDPATTNVHLSVVIFNGDDWNAIQLELLDLEERTRFSRFHLLNVNASTFSRAVALQVTKIYRFDQFKSKKL